MEPTRARDTKRIGYVMKILYINSHHFDYLQDLTYSGLCKVFGKSNIYDYRWNLKFHYSYRPYPKNIAQNKPFSLKSLLLFSYDFDVVFVAATKPDAFETYLQIAHKIPPKAKVILLDGGDRDEIGGDLERLGAGELYQKAREIRDFDVIFKREYLQNKEYAPNIHPLPFSFNLDKLPLLDGNFKYNVTFWAADNHPTRHAIFEQLRGKFDCDQNGTTPNFDFKSYPRKGDFYLQELARSKIALNARGGGWDTLRYWEIPAVGTLMITPRQQIVIPNDFIHGQSVVFCNDDASDVAELCAYYLTHQDKKEEIAKNSNAHLKTFHTDEVRVKYIFDKLKL